VTPLHILSHVVALAAAYALALPIGWERERSDRSAGLRTFPLVAIATCGFIQSTEALIGAHPEGQGQIIGGLITGVGFIGGGAILQRGKSVHGTATAASLWATGAIGTSVGLGAYDSALVIAGFTFLTLRLLAPFKRRS
jgi:putative Mg2+ transporter-C (MgtC) family protein